MLSAGGPLKSEVVGRATRHPLQLKARLFRFYQTIRIIRLVFFFTGAIHRPAEAFGIEVIVAGVGLLHEHEAF